MSRRYMSSSPLVNMDSGQNILSEFERSIISGNIAKSCLNFLNVRSSAEALTESSLNDGSRNSPSEKPSVCKDATIAGGSIYLSPCFSPLVRNTCVNVCNSSSLRPCLHFPIEYKSFLLDRKSTRLNSSHVASSYA